VGQGPAVLRRTLIDLPDQYRVGAGVAGQTGGDVRWRVGPATAAFRLGPSPNLSSPDPFQWRPCRRPTDPNPTPSATNHDSAAVNTDAQAVIGGRIFTPLRGRGVRGRATTAPSVQGQFPPSDTLQTQDASAT